MSLDYVKITTEFMPFFLFRGCVAKKKIASNGYLNDIPFHYDTLTFTVSVVS